MKTHAFVLSVFILLIFSIAPAIVHADEIIPGMRHIGWCYEIPNVDDYPDYIFVFNEPRLWSEGVINKDSCFTFYKNGLGSVYAINKSEFNASEINHEFFSKNNPKLIKSRLELYAYGMVKENDPLKDARITLRIVSLTAENLDIQKSKITFTYVDGTSEEKGFITQDVNPEPSKKSVAPTKFWYLIIPILAAIIIAVILLLRKRK